MAYIKATEGTEDKGQLVDKSTDHIQKQLSRIETRFSKEINEIKKLFGDNIKQLEDSVSGARRDFNMLTDTIQKYDSGWISQTVNENSNLTVASNIGFDPSEGLVLIQVLGKWSGSIAIISPFGESHGSSGMNITVKSTSVLWGWSGGGNDMDLYIDGSNRHVDDCTHTRCCILKFT